MTPELPWILSVSDLDKLQAALPGVSADVEPDVDDEEDDEPVKPTSVSIADVRWYLDGRSGEDAYEKGHIPGAAFVDLDSMLAAAPSEEEGRHPLPLEEKFAACMEVSGITDGSIVVAYDDASGASASRLVWLLRAMGQPAAVLDGGLQAWTEAHGEDALETGPDDVEPADSGAFTTRGFDLTWIADIDETAQAASGEGVVIDARAPERFRGETEPMDPRAGHIPGARNVFHAENVGDDGRFLSVEALRERFASVGASGSADSATPIVYCGSGVTACHNLVAMEAAGIHGKLFPGSWSQYAATDRPAATGE